MEDYIVEEKTPKGYTLKVNKIKRMFVIFDKNGEIVYADESHSKPFHKAVNIVFFGKIFKPNEYSENFLLAKVEKGMLVIPYYLKGENLKKYVFISYDTKIDMMPIFIETCDDYQGFIKIMKIMVPDFVVIASNAEDEIKLIKKISKEAKIINILGSEENDGKRAEDKLNTSDINLLSKNPVFLARVHLRNLNINQVNQILLEMDLTETDAEYIAAFIKTMLDKKDDSDIKKYYDKLKTLYDAFTFYKYLIVNDKENIIKSIENADDHNILVMYNTLISKVKSTNKITNYEIDLTTYENEIWEKIS